MGPWTKLFFINIGLALAVCVGYIYFGGLDDGTPRKGSIAPAFELPVISQATLDGRTRLALAHLKGKPALVNFWASWCTVCKSERPQLMQLDAIPELNVVGIATSDTESAAKESELLLPHGYPVTFDSSSQVSDSYAVQGLPHSFLIDPDGTILRRYGRALRDADVEEIRAMIAGLGKGKA